MESVDRMQATLVAEGIYALDEPWRSRFVRLVATYARKPAHTDLPSKDDVLTWLYDPCLNEQIRLMLRTWTRQQQIAGRNGVR